ncbi:MAG: hypothetical protein M1832_001882 [Thelocarpon impressellum]|nr:MAG: hypothetical protein M1832_001882 [Thelocarpon impressellum]
MPLAPSDIDTVLLKRDLDVVKFTNADLSRAQLPKKGTTPQLPDPSEGLKLSHVVVGRGTQNYTCKAGSTEKPVLAGAVAILYDASYLAAYHPSLLHELPGALLDIKSSSEILVAAIVGRLSAARFVLGHHYFSDATTPVFDLRATGGADLTFGKKTHNVPPPDYSSKGPGGKGDGAIDWLKLSSKDGSVNIKETYRMVTAGGVAPATCEKQPEKFEVDYAAEYWYYTG